MALYRVYGNKAQLAALPQGIQVVKAFPAFSIVDITDAQAKALQSKFTLAALPPPGSKASTAARGAAPPVVRAPKRGASATPKPSKQYHIVTSELPIDDQFKNELERIKARIIRPLSSTSLVVETSSARARDAVVKLPQVTVEDYVPQIKFNPALLQNLGVKPTEQNLKKAIAAAASALPIVGLHKRALPGFFSATFLTSADANRAKAALKNLGVDVSAAPQSEQLFLDLSGNKNAAAVIAEIVELRGLKLFEERKLRRLSNDVARQLIGAKSVAAATPIVTGLGETVAVADTGLDSGDLLTIHPDFSGRVTLLKSYPIAPSYAQLLTNPGADDGPDDVDSGHGTHVAGSVLGDGARSVALGLNPIKGVAPQCKLIFQAIEQFAKWKPSARLQYIQAFGVEPPDYTLFGIPDDLQNLFQDAFDAGARIHTNSWGGGDPGVYDQQCEQLDRFVWEHPEFLVLVAAGNSGRDVQNPKGSIDDGSVDSPGTSKNCITVGAAENLRPAFAAEAYGNWWSSDFPHASIKTDPMADNPDDIAAFSSRGPCQTGRRAIDLVAPGTFILSTRSRKIAANNFAWGAFAPAKKDYMYMGGTSMATPLAAGAAACLRQYLRNTAGHSNPSAALLKAGLIHASRYIAYRYAGPASGKWADDEQGWGHLNVDQILSPSSGVKVLFFDRKTGLTTGTEWTTKVKITAGGDLFKVTLVYNDFPGEDLINNLNLLVKSPAGSTHFGNDFDGSGTVDALNNVEGVVIENPSGGTWEIQVVGASVPQGPQPFAVVVSGKGLQPN